MEYVGKRMICDTDLGDGNVYFEKEYLEFSNRDAANPKKFRIFYKDISNVEGYRGIKSTVALTTDKGRVLFYMYKMNTFIELVNTGRKEWNVVDVEVKKESQEPLTNEQLEKLAKLNELHKDGVLSDEEFNKEKNLILNR